MEPAKQPDSTLEAAKKTAAALGLNWPTLDLIYRELQMPDAGGTGWIPKSSGRKIWTAHPHYVARLLIAFGFRPTITPHMANFIAQGLTPGGRSMWSTEWPAAGISGCVEETFTQLLTDPEAADAVAQLRFDPAAKSITVTYRDGRPALRFLPASGGFWEQGDTNFRDAVLAAMRADTSARVIAGMIIDGAVLSDIARTVNWRQSASPVRHQSEDEPDD